MQQCSIFDIISTIIPNPKCNIPYIIINILMISKLLEPMILLLLISVSSGQQDFTTFLQSTPNKFGLLTVTHARNGNYLYFLKHIEKYAGMECDLVSEISVVWNNDITPEQAGFVDKSDWKRPVYFRKTPYNSMDFRYLLPQQSKASVFFSMDDDVIVSCDELLRSFQIWKKYAIGDIGPLVSYGARGFSYNSVKQEYIYGDPQKARFYSISLIGICWVSRFYLQLYNSEKLSQLTEMRKIVKQNNNCDDIALNFLVSYLFPQLLAIHVEGPLRMEIQPSSQSMSATHYTKRNMCLKKFVQILGYNPLKILDKQGKRQSSEEMSANNKYIIYLKKIQYEQQLLSLPVKQFDAQKSDELVLQNIGQQTKDSESKQYQNSRQNEIKLLIQSAKQQKQQLIAKLHKIQTQNNQHIGQSSHTQNNQQTANQLQLSNATVDASENDKQQARQKKREDVIWKLGLLTFFCTAGSVVVFGLFLYFCKLCFLSQHELRQRYGLGSSPI